jgi:hypothetical protein
LVPNCEIHSDGQPQAIVVWNVRLKAQKGRKSHAMTDDPKRDLVMTLHHILLPAAESHCVELAELYVAYVKAVTSVGNEVLPVVPFTEKAKGHCRALGITAQVSDDKVRLEGAQLANWTK